MCARVMIQSGWNLMCKLRAMSFDFVSLTANRSGLIGFVSPAKATASNHGVFPQQTREKRFGTSPSFQETTLRRGPKSRGGIRCWLRRQTVCRLFVGEASSSSLARGLGGFNFSICSFSLFLGGGEGIEFLYYLQVLRQENIYMT